MAVFRLVIAGVGGQDTLLASCLLAETAIEEGLSVKIGETYGMVQRGGPVMGHVQIGEGVESPQIRPGEADALLGFEIGEAVRRGVSYLREGGLALVNSRRLPPVEVISGMMDYPGEEDLMALLRGATLSIISFDATALAEEAGDAIATNMVMLGALAASGGLPFSKEAIISTMERTTRRSYLETNMKAFDLGVGAYRDNI